MMTKIIGSEYFCSLNYISFRSLSLSLYIQQNKNKDDDDVFFSDEQCLILFDKKKLEKQNLFVVLFLIKNPDADDNNNDGINDVIGCMSMCECNITKIQYTFFLDKISSIAWMDGGGKRQTKTIRQNNINLRKGLFFHSLFI